MTKQPERSAARGVALGSLRGSGATATRKARDHAHALRSYLAKPMTSFYLVVTLTFALVAFGLVMMASASAVDSMQSHGSAYYQFNRQLIFLVAGVLAMILAMRVPLATWRRLSGVIMALTMVMLALVLVPGIGMELYGARRWFNVGGLFSIQPSEFGKIAFLLWGAHVLVRRRKILNTWEGMLMPILPGLILLSTLVVIEPDLHTTVTYFIIFLGLLWVIGAPFRLFGLMLLGVASVGIIAVASQGFRMSRVLAFLDPWADAQASGHQAIQGFYALATGGFFGVGLGNSRTKWGALPNAHSDYIFAIIGEELGFIGAALVLLLFAALAYTGFRIARRTRDLYIRLIAGATAIWMVGQALINIGYVVGLLPVTGITLPLISSGGTSIVVTMFAMGILASCARHEPAAVRHLQSRARRFGRWLSLPVPVSPVLDKDQAPPKAHRSPRTTSGARDARRRTEPARRTESARRTEPARRREPARRDEQQRRPQQRRRPVRDDRTRADRPRDQRRRPVR